MSDYSKVSRRNKRFMTDPKNRMWAVDRALKLIELRGTVSDNACKEVYLFSNFLLEYACDADASITD